MTTTNTRFVDPNSSAGGDGTTNGLSGATCAYVSLNVWEAARQADLPTGDIIEKVICSSDDAGSTHLADATACTIDGWTTDSTRYIQIEAATSHGGKWNDNIYRLVAGTQLLEIKENYVKITGLQFKTTDNTPCLQMTWVGAGTYVIDLDKLIVRHVGSHMWPSGIAVYEADGAVTLNLSNSLVYDFNVGGTEWGTGIYLASSSTSTINARNCTVYNCYHGFRRTGGTFNATNCGASSCGIGFTDTITQTTCSTSTPTFVDADNDDFHLAAGDTTWRGQGTDLSGTFTDDIDGDTRSAPWDIGCDEVPASGGLLSAMTTLKVG